MSKTLYYENGPLADPDYLKRAVFMASTDNYQISEGTHNWVITNHLDPNDYISEKLYTVTYNATTADVTNAFNDGRFFGIYSGHGGTYSWADGPAFSQSDVNALQNTNMYPFVCSFACITGTYTVDECFTETWSRAQNKGAVAIYGSSVNSYWTEDDVLEKRLFDAIFDDTDATPAEVGPVWNETLMRYLAEMGGDSTTRRYFEMYNLLGDPSMRFPGSCSDAGTVILDRAKYACGTQVTVTVNDCGLNSSDTVTDSVTLPIDSDSETGVESIQLFETDPASAEFVGSIMLFESNYGGALLAVEGDTITVTYQDADTGQGGGATVTATAVVDCTPPVISNVRATNVEARTATIAFDGNEPVGGTVRYGTTCAALNQSVGAGGYAMSATADLSGLIDNTTYFYAVDGEDEAGNVTTENNGGACYAFTTPEVPDFFTELFDGGDNDLDDISLIFTPNGSNDFYASCAEEITALPTDPSGGTSVSLSDDDSVQVSLTGGAQVSLYGVNYGSFYIISNGYLTFGDVDDGYSESFSYHFGAMPKISALMDDLNPSSGGTVSYKQLADRVAVTWQNVPEYNSSNSNTFQVVMYFDGTIEINYLSIAAADGLAGLSEGLGVDPDFLESDLSALGLCGPQPPTASIGSVSLPANTDVTITLMGFDDGLPDPPAALDYIITALPEDGDLYDVNAGLITAVPYTLAAGGNQVEYVPDADYYGADSLMFKVNDGGVAPEGGDSNEAMVAIQVIARPPSAQGANIEMDRNGAETIQLTATDPDGDPLDFIITSLPTHGTLADPWGNDIVAAPYTLADNGRAVVYKPAWDYVGPDAFTFKVDDGIFQTITQMVNVLVIAPAPQIVSAALPDAYVNEAYGPIQLDCVDGQPQLSWSMVTDFVYTETDLGASTFDTAGEAQSWRADEGSWTYYIPFDFPFYGNSYNNVRVYANGFMNFGVSTGSNYNNSTADLIANVRIAPMWDDLTTAQSGNDIYIDESVPGQATIRWQASRWVVSQMAYLPVNFAVTLTQEGDIRFDYGAGNTYLSPTIGISDGAGGYTLGMHDGVATLTGVNSVLFQLPQDLPEGLTLSANGLISGTPSEMGVFEPTVRVTDGLGRTDEVTLSINVVEFVAGDCDGDGDGDVDLLDYAMFQRCFSGDAEQTDAACVMFHADSDGDVDLVDFAAFRAALGE